MTWPCLGIRMKKTRVQTCERHMTGKLANYVKPRFFLAIILLVITMGTVAEADCWDDSLRNYRHVLRSRLPSRTQRCNEFCFLASTYKHHYLRRNC